jgi:hypothetical protein
LRGTASPVSAPHPCVLKVVAVALQDRDDETGRMLRALLTKPGHELRHPLGLFNRSDFVLLGGKELATLADSVKGKTK